MVYGFALVETQAHRGDELAVVEQFAVEEPVGAETGQEKSAAGASSHGDLRVHAAIRDKDGEKRRSVADERAASTTRHGSNSLRSVLDCRLLMRATAGAIRAI